MDKLIQYKHQGGVTVSTWERNIDCMQRISVGLFKKPEKQLIANTNVDKVAFHIDHVNEDMLAAAAA